MKIALDAMGGDYAPDQVVAGGVQAHRELKVDVIFVGPKDQLEPALTKAGAGKWAVIENAPEVIGMDEHPANAVRTKKNSSIARGVAMVEDGRAAGFVSAGNSGAVMAAALFGLHRIPGVERPAIGAVIPTATGRCLLLDAGANADARPEYLVQFARMGAIYAERLMDITNPKIGLLSNGEEPGKGNQLVQATEPLLKAQAGLNFVGNVEGNDLFKGKADVIVCDGFTGNVLVKTAEGAAELLFRSIRDAIKGDPIASVGGLLVRPKLQSLRQRVDWRELGGWLLLGVNGVTVIAHGRSDARAIRSAIRVARDAVDRQMIATFTSAFTQAAPAGSRVNP
ncbi:MAG TPA: phosphate acyltransferase PlsX [Candidatus Acidoferrum sp.]|nr:phosphate acyltransferase PlsX [Candidatus Acidoferrum sp.]